jgi:hypothetical protein
MNRKKKLNDGLKKKVKRANAKLRTTSKPRYISKAERAALEAADNQEPKTEELP